MSNLLGNAWLYFALTSLFTSWSISIIRIGTTYNALEWGSIFTLGLNVAKRTNYIEESFKQKLCVVKFPTKNSVEAYLYLNPPPPQ